MIRMKRALGLLLFGVLLFAFCGAQAAEEKKAIGYYVKAIFPSNQLEGNTGYFSLLTRPEGTQTLQVQVFNENSEEIEVAIEVDNAYTNRNGVIEYTAAEGTDPGNKHGLAGMIIVEEPVLKVPANGSATAKLRLAMPKETIDGELLAGVTITRIPDAEEEGAQAAGGGMQIRNIFAYCIAIRVTQNLDRSAAPDFALTGARMGKIAGFPAIVLDVVNLRPLIYSGVALDVNVYPREGGEPALSYEMLASMTPNVSAPLSKMLTEEQALKPGAYRVEATLRYEERTWRFEAPLVVE